MVQQMYSVEQYFDYVNNTSLQQIHIVSKSRAHTLPHDNMINFLESRQKSS